MKTIHNEKGFTLIEMLLVLMITCITISIIMKVSFHYILSYAQVQFDYEVMVTHRAAQFLANSNKGNAYVGIRDENELYVHNPYNYKDVINHKLPEGFEVNFYKESTIKINSIRYNSELEMSPTIAAMGIISPQKKTRYTLNLGKGRITIAK